MYDWSKLPTSEHNKAIQLFNNSDWDGLLQLHDKYKISGYTYCCASSAVGLLNHFAHAIQEGFIEPQAESSQGEAEPES